MSLINKNNLRKDILAMPNCYNGFSGTYDKSFIIGMIDEQPTVEAIPIEWVKRWAMKSENTYNREQIIEMLNAWEKENG